MPERILIVKWPDSQQQKIYSPSSIISTYFNAGDQFEVQDFLNKSMEALQHASHRVEEKYGYACSSAMSSIEMVISKANEFSVENQGKVEVLAIE